MPGTSFLIQDVAIELTFSDVSSSNSLLPNDGSSIPERSGPLGGVGATRALGPVEEPATARASDGSSTETPYVAKCRRGMLNVGARQVLVIALSSSRRLFLTTMVFLNGILLF